MTYRAAVRLLAAAAAVAGEAGVAVVTLVADGNDEMLISCWLTAAADAGISITSPTAAAVADVTSSRFLP